MDVKLADKFCQANSVRYAALVKIVARLARVSAECFDPEAINVSLDCDACHDYDNFIVKELNYPS